MSPRILTRLAIALVLLLGLWGAVALGSHNRDTAQQFRPPRIATKDVDTIIITGPRDTAVLARQGSNDWRVNGHPADRRQMEDLLNALADTTPTGDLVVESPASYGQVGVDSASGHRIRVVSKGKTVADLFAGQAGTVYGTGYIRAASDRGAYLARTALPRLADRPVDEWRDQKIGGVAKDSVSRVEVQRGSKRYALTKQAGRWTLVPGGATDSAAVANFLADLGDVRANGFASSAQADSFNFKSPKRRLSVLGLDGKPRLTLAFDSTKSGVWSRTDTGTTVWRLDQWTLDRVTPADSTLKARRKP